MDTPMRQYMRSDYIISDRQALFHDNREGRRREMTSPRDYQISKFIKLISVNNRSI